MTTVAEPLFSAVTRASERATVGVEMTRSELEDRLRRERIHPLAYDLSGIGRDEAYCIERTPAGWLVCYRERGHRNYEHLFQSESEAHEFFLHEFFLKEVLQDPTTRH